MNSSMLAINNAFSPTLIAFESKNGEYFSVRENPPKKFPNNILFIIESFLKAFSIKPNNIGAIAVVNGPGSFTGTRITVVEAKIIAYSLSIPLVAINSVKLIGNIVQNGTVALPAGRNEFFTAEFKNGKMTGELKCTAIDKIDSKEIYSVKKIENEFGRKINVVSVSGEQLLKYAKTELEKGEIYKDPLALKPIYLRSTDLLFKKRK